MRYDVITLDATETRLCDWCDNSATHKTIHADSHFDLACNDHMSLFDPSELHFVNALRGWDMDTTTIICGDCSEGTYVAAESVNLWACETCGHTITTRDLDLDEGESLTLDARGHLAYVATR